MVLGAGCLIMPNKGDMLAQLMAAALVLCLPGLIYIATARRFATLLNQCYPVAGGQWPVVGGDGMSDVGCRMSGGYTPDSRQPITDS